MQNNKHIFQKTVLLVSAALIFFFGGLCPGHLSAAMIEAKDAIDSKEISEIDMMKGELVTLKVYSLTRLSITNPDVADVTKADSDQLLIIGKNVGQTSFFIWDEFGKRTVILRVVDEDLYLIKNRLQKLLDIAEIKNVNLMVNAAEGKVVATGALPKNDVKRLNDLVQRFGDSVLNLAKEEVREDLIQINVQISELSTTLQESLGFDWTAGTADLMQLKFQEALPSVYKDGFERLLKVGDITRTTALLATVDMLISEGKARILSKPRLVVVSGKEASFQVGGQIPIRTTSTASGGANITENVTFKDYGIIMTITPTLRNGKIDIVLNVEISDVDASNAVGDDVAYSTRSAQTQLVLDDQQTIVLAGLIKQSKSKTIKKIPFLGDIPIIGMVFRKQSTPTADQDTEIVISLTPTVLTSDVEKRSEEPWVKEEKKSSERTIEIASSEKEKEKISGSLTEEIPMKDEGPAAAKESFPASEEEGKNAPAVSKEEIQQRLPYAQGRPEEGTAETISKGLLAPTEGPGASEQEAVIENASPKTKSYDLITDYVHTVQQKISQAISYPYEAIENGWQGTVKLTLRILKDGTLDEASIKESSGHNIFDKDALNTAQILAPFPAFPLDLDLEEIIITLPIVYSQDAVSASADSVCRVNVDSKKKELTQSFVPSGKPYAALIQEQIAQALIYPQEAKEKKWQGTAVLTLRILRDGTLAHATVEESSGYKIFDECAMQTAKSVAPYAIFPAEANQDEVNVTVPIVYSLERK